MRKWILILLILAPGTVGLIFLSQLWTKTRQERKTEAFVTDQLRQQAALRMTTRYEKIQEGMTLDEVNQIMEAEGQIGPERLVDSTLVREVSWEDAYGHSVVVSLHDGRVLTARAGHQ